MREAMVQSIIPCGNLNVFETIQLIAVAERDVDKDRGGSEIILDTVVIGET